MILSSTGIITNIVELVQCQQFLHGLGTDCKYKTMWPTNGMANFNFNNYTFFISYLFWYKYRRTYSIVYSQYSKTYLTFYHSSYYNHWSYCQKKKNWKLYIYLKFRILFIYKLVSPKCLCMRILYILERDAINFTINNF